jgi:hypothetical protein
LDKCHKDRQQFIFENGVGVLSNPKEALENIDPDDYVMQSNPGGKKKHFFASHSLNCDDHEEGTDAFRKKRTILDGI